jgi:hypothetical protein
MSSWSCHAHEDALRVDGSDPVHIIATVTSGSVLKRSSDFRARRAGNDDASRAVQAAAGLVAEVLPVIREDVLRAGPLLGRFPRLGARGAVHAAVMELQPLYRLGFLVDEADVDLERAT